MRILSRNSCCTLRVLSLVVSLFALLTIELSSLSAQTVTYQLLLSFSPDRSSPVLLQGATVTGDIYVFTSPDTGVNATSSNRVEFFIDDPQMLGAPFREERLAPFDLGGGTVDLADPVNASTFGNGSHTITARLPLGGGTEEVIHATFTVGEPTTNQAPILAPIGDQTVAENGILTVPLTATDPDNDPVTFSASGLPSFATLTDDGDGSGALDLAPLTGDNGTYSATVSTSDGLLADSETFTIEVIDSSGPPTIASQPRDQTVVEGRTATFTVDAMGSVPLSYQWRQNGVNIDGATSASYTTGPVSAGGSNTLYSVQITNAFGNATSSEAKLFVIPDESVDVDPSNRRWLYYSDGSPYYLCGPGDPEGFLYRGSRNPDGTRDGDQLALIDKVAGTGANGIYMSIIRSNGGDGGATENPFIDSNPAQGLDSDILDQWETWFTAMDEAGILIFLIFFDDSANIWGGGDSVPPEEQAFIEAIVDRFYHHKRLIWVVAEEYGEAFSATRVSNIAAIVRAADPADHVIAVHKNNGISFVEFEDDPNVDQFAVQLGNSPHQDLVTAFSDAEGRYNLNLVELLEHGTGALARRNSWAAAMAGAYVMVYQMDIANTDIEDLEDCGRLVRFMEVTLFREMEPADELAFGGTEFVLAGPPDLYILYASSLSGEIGVSGIASGTYDFLWYDIVNGEMVRQENVSVSGGDMTWPSPPGIGQELALYIEATNRRPVGVFFADPTSGDAPLVVNFDATGSFDPDGSIVNYAWDFGDGNNGTGVSPTHIYAALGTYTVTLTVTDNLGASTISNGTIIVSPTGANNPPDAGFDYDCTGLNCSFTDTSSDSDGSIVFWSWDFGDSTNSTDQNPTHSYANEGIFIANLTVTDDGGLSDTVSQTITVTENSPPVASFSTSPTSGEAPLLVDFDATASDDPDGTIASYAWNFGDGNNGSGVAPSHTYTGAGSFTVTLMVTDGEGATNVASATVNVTDPVRPWPTSGWTAATASEVGMDQALLDQARNYALSEGGAGYITRHGLLVESWGNDSTLFDIKSTTKSIGSGILGLAISDGLVDLDDLAQQHFPSVGIPPNSNGSTGWLDILTLRQLATLSGGFDRTGGYVDQIFEPGTAWGYSDASVNWLADTLTVVFDQDLQPLLLNRIFQPLGLSSSDLSWRSNQNRDNTINGITSRELASGISVSVDTMARIGYLYLNGGVWNGQQILPVGFVDSVRIPAQNLSGLPVVNDVNSEGYGGASSHYGILWWNNGDGSMANVPTDAYWSWGTGDSLILIIPSLDIVASRAGNAWPGERMPNFYALLEPFIEPIALSVVGTSNQSPTASFTANPTSGEAPLLVDFDATASDDPRRHRRLLRLGLRRWQQRLGRRPQPHLHRRRHLHRHPDGDRRRECDRQHHHHGDGDLAQPAAGGELHRRPDLGRGAASGRLRRHGLRRSRRHRRLLRLGLRRWQQRRGRRPQPYLHRRRHLHRHPDGDRRRECDRQHHHHGDGDLRQPAAGGELHRRPDLGRGPASGRLRRHGLRRSRWHRRLLRLGLRRWQQRRGRRPQPYLHRRRHLHRHPDGDRRRECDRQHHHHGDGDLRQPAAGGELHRRPDLGRGPASGRLRRHGLRRSRRHHRVLCLGLRRREQRHGHRSKIRCIPTPTRASITVTLTVTNDSGCGHGSTTVDGDR